MSTALFSAFYGDSDRARDMAGQSLEMSLTPSPTHWAYQASILFLSPAPPRTASSWLERVLGRPGSGQAHGMSRLARMEHSAPKFVGAFRRNEKPIRR